MITSWISACSWTGLQRQSKACGAIQTLQKQSLDSSLRWRYGDKYIYIYSCILGDLFCCLNEIYFKGNCRPHFIFLSHKQEGTFVKAVVLIEKKHSCCSVSILWNIYWPPPVETHYSLSAGSGNISLYYDYSYGSELMKMCTYITCTHCADMLFLLCVQCTECCPRSPRCYWWICYSLQVFVYL